MGQVLASSRSCRRAMMAVKPGRWAGSLAQQSVMSCW